MQRLPRPERGRFDLRTGVEGFSENDGLRQVPAGQVRDVGGTKFIMPALGDNKNVMCYVDDLYVYLRARSTDALPGGRISADQRADKPKEAIEAEKACIGD